MTNWKNRIYDNLIKLVNDNTITFVSTNELKLVNDKTICFQMLSNVELENDLENTEENAQNIEIQLDIYTKSLNDGYVIADKAVNAMKKMSFSKDFGIEVMANIDTDFKRLVARFSRVVGSGDEIYKI